jgi:hypothetical protein
VTSEPARTVKGGQSGIIAMISFAIRLLERSEFENNRTKRDLTDALTTALTVALRWQKEQNVAPRDTAFDEEP